MKNHIPVIYRKAILDVMIYTYITAQRYLIPSISVQEAAKSFIANHMIDEDELSLDSVTTTFWRFQKEVFNEAKSH